MSAPDNELIAETLLFAEGYKFAKELGKKIISVFTLGIIFTKKFILSNDFFINFLKVNNYYLNKYIMIGVSEP